ncbi:MAG: thiamine pyrophosphate-dependent enzyme [Caldilineaceae bacterium]
MDNIAKMNLNKTEHLALYAKLFLIRFTEEQLARPQRRAGAWRLPHLCGRGSHCRRRLCAPATGRRCLSTHRGHGHALAKGVPPREVIAELFGRATGCSRGRGGSMHLFSPEVGMMGTSGIVGAIHFGRTRLCRILL